MDMEERVNRLASETIEKSKGRGMSIGLVCNWVCKYETQEVEWAVRQEVKNRGHRIEV